ncbi:antitoxin [Sphingomonas adhaesiva]|uniref:antitoxin n=1 Tax=Sphingomonas adhaesiva TaxID=28212 RepID=UPI002FF88342
MAISGAVDYVARMKHEPTIFEERDRDAEAAAIARARADVAAGRVHSHEVVKEWLMTWGKANRLPFKEWLAARNGDR